MCQREKAKAGKTGSCNQFRNTCTRDSGPSRAPGKIPAASAKKECPAAASRDVERAAAVSRRDFRSLKTAPHLPQTKSQSAPPPKASSATSNRKKQSQAKPASVARASAAVANQLSLENF